MFRFCLFAFRLLLFAASCFFFLKLVVLDKIPTSPFLEFARFVFLEYHKYCHIFKTIKQNFTKSRKGCIVILYKSSSIRKKCFAFVFSPFAYCFSLLSAFSFTSHFSSTFEFFLIFAFFFPLFIFAFRFPLSHNIMGSVIHNNNQ